jgi:SecD/SecF fusion protein
MFTALSVTRILMAAVVRRQKLKTIRIEPLVRFFPEKTSIAFMKGRYLGIATSIFLSVASVVLFIKPGLNYGIDFKGGIQVEITTSQPADLAALRSTLGEIGVGEVTLQQVGDGNDDVLIRVQRQDGSKRRPGRSTR